MAPVGEVVLAFTISALAFLLGWLANERIRRRKIDSAQVAVKKIISDAEEDAETLKKTAVLEAKDEWRRERDPLENELETANRSLRDLEAKLLEREQQLDRKVDILDSKERRLLKTEKAFEQHREKAAADEARIEEMIREQQQRLESLAGMDRAEARERLISQQEESARQFAARKVKEIKDNAIASANREAKDIVARSIQRFAGELSVESTVSVVNIPSDEMKGRIIGRDGRNIRSFEMITGVEVIVDDTPGMVMLSSFDPLRREVARNTLEKLILDGRIHPGRIEEIYEKARADVEELIRESGSKAAFDLGIHDLAGPLLELLGQLRFHTSHGQNLLTHSKEVGILAGMMADELRLNAALARRAGLLHDIGKAISHEVGNDPVQASAALARKCGENPDVVQVIETHSHDVPSRPTTAILVDIANDVSTSRPGAQNEKGEQYARRLEHIEKIAMSLSGVEKAYALQNGREIRVLVDSAIVDDAYADQIADEIADKLEQEVDQPGQIKVCIIREVRAIHYAR